MSTPTFNQRKEKVMKMILTMVNYKENTKVKVRANNLKTLIIELPNDTTDAESKFVGKMLDDILVRIYQEKLDILHRDLSELYKLDA